jgi:SAM-dependent methyltransferase
MAERFDGRQDDYERARPSYPPALLDALADAGWLGGRTDCADIGAGTGRFSDLLLAREVGSVAAIDPSRDMLAVLSAKHRGDRRLRALVGSAEATGLPDASVDFIASAQAFHWFEPLSTRAEWRRILRPQGRVCLLWNNRSETGGAMPAIEELLNRYFKSERDAVPHDARGRVGRAEAFLPGARRLVFRHEKPYDEALFADYLGSVSYIPRDAPERRQLAAELFERYSTSGVVTLVYDCIALVGVLPAD